MKALMVLLLCAGAGAQIVRVRPRPNLYIPGTMSVSATPGTVNVTLAQSGVAAASQSITISSSWTIGIAATASLYGYFASTSALTSGSYAVNASSVLGQCTTGSAPSFTAFTGTGPFATGTSLLIFARSVLVSLLESHTDTLNLEIDLSSQPQLPAGTYSGTLILQLQAT